jgi:hypothetical protein
VASSRTITGTLIRNTEPHQKWSSRNPLTSGPIAVPLEKTAIQTASAARRCPGSWNMLRVSAMVEGISVAPATPSTARAPMRVPALCAYADAAEASPNAPAPSSSRCRRPMRSPRVPMVISRPDSTNP